MKIQGGRLEGATPVPMADLNSGNIIHQEATMNPET